MAYKVKYQIDNNRPYTVRRLFVTVREADDYVQDLEREYCELIYDIIDAESNKTVFTGALCN